jgi:Transglycosylase SLT domain
VNITKYEHTIVIGIISALIGVGIGTHVGVTKTPIPVKKIIELPKELTPVQARKLAASKLDDYGWTKSQFTCLNEMWNKESHWNYKAVSKTHDHGIPQRNMPDASKKAIHAFQTDPEAQINWGLGYIKSRYKTPCNAWAFWQKHHWY